MVLVYGNSWPKAEREGQRRDEGAGVGEEIAVGGVEGEVVLVAEVHANTGSLVARRGGGDTTVRVDGRGDAGVGGAQDPAVVLDGSHADHVEVLPTSTGVAVPAIVGDVDQNLCAIFDELADLVTEDGLVTDEGAVVVAAKWEDSARGTAIHVTGASGELAGEEEEVLEGDVLSP